MHRLVAVTVIAKPQLLLFTITRIAFSLGKVHAVLLIFALPLSSLLLLPLFVLYTCLIIPPVAAETVRAIRLIDRLTHRG